VLDAFSRVVVGWAIDSTQTTTLVLNALGMATRRRVPEGELGHPLRPRRSIHVLVVQPERPVTPVWRPQWAPSAAPGSSSLPPSTTTSSSSTTPAAATAPWDQRRLIPRPGPRDRRPDHRVHETRSTPPHRLPATAIGGLVISLGRPRRLLRDRGRRPSVRAWSRGRHGVVAACAVAGAH
jgi:hypothetical protein